MDAANMGDVHVNANAQIDDQIDGAVAILWLEKKYNKINWETTELA